MDVNLKVSVPAVEKLVDYGATAQPLTRPARGVPLR